MNLNEVGNRKGCILYPFDAWKLKVTHNWHQSKFKIEHKPNYVISKQGMANLTFSHV